MLESEYILLLCVGRRSCFICLKRLLFWLEIFPKSFPQFVIDLVRRVAARIFFVAMIGALVV